MSRNWIYMISDIMGDQIYGEIKRCAVYLANWKFGLQSTPAVKQSIPGRRLNSPSKKERNFS